MRLFFAFCLFSAAAAHAAEDASAVLLRIRQTVATAVSRSDNYICAQDLSRFYYIVSNSAVACRQPPAVPPAPLRVQDRLKLDVAVSEGSEIYSWHGERKFSAGSVGEVVREGPISSGSFSGYLRNIFGDHDATFIYKGRSPVDGVDLYHFDYQVALAASHYELQAGKAFVLAPFHGSFSAKAADYELYSLTVTANGDQISPKSDICASTTRLTYQLVKMSSHESLLPASFDLLIGARSGIFTESKGSYSECHEYTGESTVHFDFDDAAKETAVAPELESEPLHPGLYLQIALRGQLDEDTVYAGLPVEAVLVRDARIKKGEKLTRGATLRGTVTSFRVFHQPTHLVEMKIEFNSITDGKKLYMCSAIHGAEFAFQPGFSGVRRRGSVPPPQLNMPEQPADGTLTFNTPHLHLDKSFTSTFVTVSHSATEER